MLVVIDFDRGIDTQQDFDFLHVAVGALDDQGRQLLGTNLAFQAFQVKRLLEFPKLYVRHLN